MATTATRKVAKAAVEVDSTPFVVSHGKEPRGVGCWAFSFGRADKFCPPLERVWFAPHGSFTSAKREAVAEAARRGETMVWVQP